MPDIPKRPDLSKRNLDSLKKNLDPIKKNFDPIIKDVDPGNKLKHPIRTELQLSKADFEKIAEINPIFKKVLDGGIAKEDHIKVSFDKYIGDMNQDIVIK